MASTAYYSRCLPSVVTSLVNGRKHQLIAKTTHYFILFYLAQHLGVTNALTANDSSSNVSYSITDLTGNGITDQSVAQAAKYVINLLNIQSTGKYIRMT